MFDLKRLEFHKVLRILAGYCVSENSKKRMIKVRPSGSVEAIELQFELIEELRRVIDEGHAATQPMYNDISDLLHRASVIRSRLDLDELVMIRENLRTAALLKRQCDEIGSIAPRLAERFGSIPIPAELQAHFGRTLDERGGLRSDASTRLEEIENDIKRTRGRIENLLELYLNDPETRHYFQERHITVKDDRFVIPLKQNFKGRIPGVVHAHSGSEKTVFVEPFSVVDINNELRRLNKEREKEINRILVSLTGTVRSHTDGLRDCQETLGGFDMLMAKKRFMDEFSCTVPEFIDEDRIALRGARHPLITGEVVPIDFSLADPFHGVVITGPNTGGKTVSLKTIGLMVLLAQSGIPVPASSMKSRVFGALFCDLGDESSIEQSLSTFSAHIKNIGDMVRKADSRSLVLIDELGAGTDPIEGGALGTAILDYLMDRKVMTVVTTHFSFIKLYALRSKSTEVASVEFDAVTCRPTYRLVMGIPGRSNALEVAEKLELETEILKRSREYLSDEARTMDDIFKNLARMEQDLSMREKEIAETRERLEGMVGEYDGGLKDLNRRRDELGSQFQQDFTELMADFRSRLEGCIRQLREEAGSRDSVQAARDEMVRVEKDFRQFTEDLQEKGRDEDRVRLEPATEDLAPGDRVSVSTTHGDAVEGKVIGLKDGKVTLMAGSLKLTADLNRVRKILPGHGGGPGRGPERGVQRRSWDFTPAQDRPKVTECDIRGMRYEEAMEELERFIDNAVLNNLGMVHVIHGLGTGALREGVQENLKKNRFVARMEYARPEQGGFGCTIVTLKS